MLERAGMTPMQAIMAGTCPAADLLGRRDLGRIRKGKIADIIVLESAVVLVMKEGFIHDGFTFFIYLHENFKIKTTLIN